METLSIPGIVIRIQNLGEADQLLSLLCAQGGVVAAKAPGAKKSQKRFMGGLDLLDAGKFELQPQQRDAHRFTLLGMGEREVWPNLRTDLEKFRLALLCLEITQEFAPEGDPSGSAYFKPLFQVLKTLNSSTSSNLNFSLLSFFALKSLELAGLNPLEDMLLFKESEELRVWLISMLEQNSPIVPFEKDLSKKGLLMLTVSIEQAFGRKLRVKLS